MNVLVFGKTGQVALELMQYEGVTCLGRDDADLTDAEACKAIILSTDADVVINAAAYTSVDLAENEYKAAMIVNADTPTSMATASAERGIPFVHISTDYVFNGLSDLPFTPIDTPNPQSIYGKSKLAGEKGVAASGGVHAILRTSWVFSANGENFVKTMLRLASERDSLNIVSDQIGGPTPASHIAASCMKIANSLLNDPNLAGIYHLSGKPDVSWADFAREIFYQSGLSIGVKNISTSDFPTLAKRPLNSRLDCSTTHSAFGIERPDWRTSLIEIISELKGS
ncbi:dTDP-4-dehydrorhamnose reductase [Amylibacter sp.]|nr:dTDP-4-dehydrorhamnose reductase [Amylibacter sp.]